MHVIDKELQYKKLVEFFFSGAQLRYKRGEAVIRAGDTPSGIYYIDEGFVKATGMTKYGEENILMIRRQGEVFPLIWAFTGLHRDISYETMSPCILWKVSKEAYLEFLDKNPEVLPIVLDAAIEMYRLHSERVNSLEYRTVRERAISFLLILADRFGVQKGSCVCIEAPIKRQDIACSISATRETTSREFSILAKKGLIAEVDGRIQIKNIEELRALL